MLDMLINYLSFSIKRSELFCSNFSGEMYTEIFLISDICGNSLNENSTYDFCKSLKVIFSQDLTIRVSFYYFY